MKIILDKVHFTMKFGIRFYQGKCMTADLVNFPIGKSLNCDKRESFRFYSKQTTGGGVHEFNEKTVDRDPDCNTYPADGAGDDAPCALFRRQPRWVRVILRGGV